jgi:hypothetical protein
MPIWQKLVAKYSRVAGEITSMSKETAVSISDIVKTVINGTAPGINWNWDARDQDPSSGFGWSGVNFSFPGQPSQLTENGILGGLLVKGELATNPVPGQANTVKLEVGYYHKVKGASGEGQYSMETDLGTYDINFDDKGNPDWAAGADSGQAQDLSQIGNGVKGLIEHIVANPPIKSKSKAVQKKVQKLQQEKQLRERGETQLQQEKADLSGPYSSVEAFFDHTVEESGGIYGLADLDMLLRGMFKSQADRSLNRQKTMQELKDAGLTYDPKKKTVSAGPAAVADILRIIARSIDSAKTPSMAGVISDIESVVTILT